MGNTCAFLKARVFSRKSCGVLGSRRVVAYLTSFVRFMLPFRYGCPLGRF